MKSQLAYGLGTANYKSTSGYDQSVVAITKTAIDLGYHHLDGAEGKRSHAPTITPDALTRAQCTETKKSSARP